MGATCVASAKKGTFDEKQSLRSKQYALSISKETLSDVHISTVQGYIRDQLNVTKLDSELIIPREVMDLILFFYALHSSSIPQKISVNASDTWAAVERDIMKHREYHIVDLLYNESDHSDVQCQVAGPKPVVKPKHFHKMSNVTLMSGVAEFLRGLPQSSKQKIWTHAVVWEQVEGINKVLDKTTSRDHIEQLLCDLVVVYMKVESVSMGFTLFVFQSECILNLYIYVVRGWQNSPDEGCQDQNNGI